jgi:large subunit ribosomal protein L29
MALKDAESKPLKMEQIRELSGDDLRDALTKLQEAQFRLKFRAGTEKVDNPLRFRIMRRNIARMKTVLRERTD